MKRKYVGIFGLMVLAAFIVLFLSRKPYFDCVIWKAGGAKTTTTTIYATLITVLLALLTLAVTAYIFLAGSLKERKAPYEQESVGKLLTFYTRILLFLTAASLLSSLFCFLLDNTTLRLWDSSPRWMIALSCVVSVLLFVYTILIICHERLLFFFASSSRKGLFSASLHVDQPEQTDEVFKWIGDLETLVERLIQNHRKNFHASSDASVLRCITSEEFERDYTKLISYRNFLQVEQQWKKSPVSLRYSEYHRVHDTVRSLEGLLRSRVLEGERLQDQSFTAPFLSQSTEPLRLNGTVFTNVVFEKNPNPGRGNPGIDFHNAELRGADFTRARLNCLNLKGATCREAIFTDSVLNQILVDADSCFERAVFTNADFGHQPFCARQGVMRFDSASFASALLVDCVFEWCSFRYAAFQQAVMSSVRLHSVCLSYADLSEAVLTGARLTFCQNGEENRFDREYYRRPGQTAEDGPPSAVYEDSWDGRQLGPAFFVNLEKCVLSQARIHNYNFTGSRMSSANFSDALVEHCVLDRCYGQRASFQNAVVKHCRFSFAMFSLVDLSYAQIAGCDFSDCDLRDSLFVQARAGGDAGSASGSRFRRANFSHAQVRACEFQDCDFSDALMEDADLRDTVFKNCVFSNTSFLHADLRRAEFRDCDLTNVDFTGLDLTAFKRINCKGFSDRPQKTTGKRRNHNGRK